MSTEREGVQLNSEAKLNLVKGPTEPSEIDIRVYKKLLDRGLLMNAYSLVSKTKGANTKGIEEITLDGYSRQTIDDVIASLKDHSFQFKPIRIVYIPKKDGKMRPLGIPSPRDKVIQKAATLILEEVYEGEFLECSHGFRRGRGTHTALKQVRTWNGTK